MAVLGLTFTDGVVADGYTVKATSQNRYSERVTNPSPSLEDVQAAFGGPAEAGAGFVGILNPSGAGTSCYLCVCDGTNWWFRALSQAV